MQNYLRRIYALEPAELEPLVRAWISREQHEAKYYEVAIFGGANDKGRDVVGFLSPRKHEGVWHNYQCKHYAKPLQAGTILLEIGKILFHAHAGAFTAPAAYRFVCPKGLSSSAQDLLYNPDKFKRTLLSQWKDHCASHISTAPTPLSLPLRRFIRAYDFSQISAITAGDLITAPGAVTALRQFFDPDMARPPAVTIPPVIQQSESRYVNELVDAYGERRGAPFADGTAALSDATHGRHLSLQRERYYVADAFQRQCRDNTEEDVLADLENEIYHGVIETCLQQYPDRLKRVDAVMTRAGSISPSGPLARRALIPVRQGVCHHFVNRERLSWTGK